MRMSNGVEWIKKSVRPQAKSSGVATHDSTGTERMASTDYFKLTTSQVKPERSACSVILYIQLNAVRLF